MPDHSKDTTLRMPSMVRTWCSALLAFLAAPVLAQTDVQTAARPATMPEEIVLRDDPIIEVTLGGIPVRLEVETDEFGPPVINPDIVARLQLLPARSRGWRIGPVVIDGQEGDAAIDFGYGAQETRIAWADIPVTDHADGVIGVHSLPWSRVIFQLVEPAPGERELRFPLKRRGGRSNTRLGTEIEVGRKRMTFIFSLQRAPNLITAPTANFIATHHEGGFMPDSEGVVDMRFDVQRPTRVMRVAYPIQLGELAIRDFAVRVEDYGSPNKVGEIEPGDPRFTENMILVSRRKGRGKPDRLTRLGRDQIAHCSRLTYDLVAMEARLLCGE